MVYLIDICTMPLALRKYDLYHIDKECGMRRNYTVIMVLAVIVALAVFWYEEHKVESNIIKNHVVAAPVTVIKVKRETVPSRVEAVGTLQAQRQVDIAPQISGQITSISYRPGSYVKAGKVLIQLDSQIYQSKLASAESAFVLASANYKRVLQLARSGAASRQMLDQQRATYQQAKAAVTTNKTLLAETSVKAPFAGYVGPKNYSLGDYVQEGEKLTTLTDRSQLLVNYQLSERYLPKLKLGQEVKISLPNQNIDQVNGKVSYISPIINQTTHSVSIQATVPNKENLLAPGLFVKIQQVTHINQDALVIPQASIVPTITGPKVFVVEKNKVKEVSVKTGATFNNAIEIRHGLKEGDTVVVAGQQRLQDGTIIKEVSS
jgi:membrane fusion protein (multidrug efflux system)